MSHKNLALLSELEHFFTDARQELTFAHDAPGEESREQHLAIFVIKLLNMVNIIVQKQGDDLRDNPVDTKQ